MGVADGDGVVRARARGRGQDVGELGAGGRRGPADIARVHPVDGALQGDVDPGAAGGVLRQPRRQLEEDREVLDELPHGQVPQRHVDPPQPVQRVVAGGLPVAQRRRREPEAARHVRVRGRLDVDVDGVGLVLPVRGPVEGGDRLDRRAVRAPQQALGLEARLGVGEAQVDDELDPVALAPAPAVGDDAGGVEPGRAPRRAPGVARTDRLVVLGRRVREGDRLARGLPGGQGQGDRLGVDRGGDPLAQHALGALLDQSGTDVHGSPFSSRLGPSRAVSGRLSP